MACDGGSFLAMVASLWWPWWENASVFAFSIGSYSSASTLRIKPVALTAFDHSQCGILSIEVEALYYSFATTLTVTLHSDWTHHISDRNSRGVFQPLYFVSPITANLHCSGEGKNCPCHSHGKLSTP